ncbi:AI-2E family transporter [Planctomycetota bacterium]
MAMDGRSSAAVPKALVSVASLIVIIAGLKAAVNVVIPLLLAGFIAILFSPLLTWLGRRGVHRGFALFLIIALVSLAGIGGITILGTSIPDFAQELPKYDEKLNEQMGEIVGWFKAHGVDTTGIESFQLFDAGAIMRYTSRALNSLSGALTNGFMILMIVIFMLTEAVGFPMKLKAAFGERHQIVTDLNTFLDDVNRYMAIKAATSLATGVLVTLLLMALHVNYYVLWGVLASILNFIPNIGSILAAIPPVLIALIQLGFGSALGTAVGFVVINTLIGNVIEPRVMGKGLGLSTLVVFLSLIFWGWILGPVGMLLSVPLTIMVKMALDSSEETRWLAVLLGR